MVSIKNSKYMLYDSDKPDVGQLIISTNEVSYIAIS